MRYLCVHSHFYQPPRENPWLEEIELQDSAFPYHDWNERINSECYARNAAARILDNEDRIEQIVNVYARISFNVGPTLLSWMMEKSPETYRAILAADAASRKRFGGHGSAMAQVYNHAIMPLANARDKRTQVLWGIADFRSRYGRAPEGMWLSETAVDLETLSILAAEGIRFTVLAPSQARAVREIGVKAWTGVSGGRIDPTRAYRAATPSGPIALFFYDGPVSQAVAFEGLLDNGVHFAERLVGAFPAPEKRGQLMHIATDGETYGHHHKFGEMALAYALHYIETNRQARITNYGEFLELNPPSYEVEIVENTAWSCSHGVGRWNADCGCNSGAHPGWNQKWRAPLRAALDWLRDELAPLYESHCAGIVPDPWAARDEYISVVLDRSEAGCELFASRHFAAALAPEKIVTAWKLLEMQRHLMLMYTSCGWFFDDISGIETVQVIQYAGRAVQLAQELFGDSLEARFLEKLASAKSNVAAQGDGAAIYRALVMPAMASLETVSAHFAVNSMFERLPDRSAIYCYDVLRQEAHEMESGQIRLTTGRAGIHSRITQESERFCYAVLHFGDQNIHARVGKLSTPESFSQLSSGLAAAFARSDLAAVIRIMDQGFTSEISLRSLFKDAQRRIAREILSTALDDTEQAHRRLYERHIPLLRMLHEMSIPVPDALRAAAEFALNGMLKDEFSADEFDSPRIASLLDEAAKAGVTLDTTALELTLRATTQRIAAPFFEKPRSLDALKRLTEAVSLTRALPFFVGLWSLQNRCYDLAQSLLAEMEKRAAGGSATAAAWTASFRDLRERLRLKV